MKEKQKRTLDWNKSFYSLSNGTTVTSEEITRTAEKYLAIYHSVGVTLLICAGLIVAAMSFDIVIEGISNYTLTVGVIASILFIAGMLGVFQYKFSNRIRFGIIMMNYLIRQTDSEEPLEQQKK